MIETTQWSAGEPRLGLDDLQERVHFRLHFPHSVRREQESYDYVACPRCDSGAKRHLGVFDNGCYCFKGGCHWSPYAWLTEIEGLAKADAFRTLRALSAGDLRVPPPRPRDPLPALVPAVVGGFRAYADAAHAALTPATRAWWRARGVDDAAIDRFTLGAHGGWRTIPCTDTDGAVFTLKQRWHDGAPPAGAPRYMAIAGSSPRHAPWVLPGTAADVCVIVAGEIKALALWSAVRAAGLDWAVATPTGGERNWSHAWATIFNAYPRLGLWPDRDAEGHLLVDNVHAHNLGRAALILPRDRPECKAVDDYLLDGGDALAAIADALKIRRKEPACPPPPAPPRPSAPPTSCASDWSAATWAPTSRDYRA